MARRQTQTGGRDATTGVIPGSYALSVGKPDKPIPDGWNWTLLTDIARLESGHTPSRRHPEYWGGEIPWIGIRDATSNYGRTIYDTEQHTNQLGIDNSSARVLPEGTVCLSRTASVGYVIVMGRPMATSQDFVNWVCGDRINNQFLKYVLIAERESFNMFSMGTTHQTIYYPEVKAFHVALPPIDEQDAIAQLLCALDDKIELNRRINKTLEAMAQLIFKDWFIHFGPTRAKAEGSDPYLAPELWDLFPDTLDDEDMPSGWKQGMLADVADSPRRGVSPADVAEDTPYIGLEHMPRRSIALSEWEGAGTVTSNKSGFKKDEFLFGKLRPYFHKVGFAPLDGICSTDIVVVIPRAPEWGAFTLACLSSDEFVNYTDQTSTGTKMPRTSWKTMGQYKVSLPSVQIARAFQSVAQPLLDRIGANIHEARTLAQTRDLLLPKLMSGEIRLRDAEEVVEAVA